MTRRFLLLLFLINIPFASAGEAKIAAAASLTFVLEEIVDQFEDETGHTIKISFASSGTLTRQIEQGAPFELFLSADESYIERLFENHVTEDTGQIYASGRLVLFQPDQNSLEKNLSFLDENLASLKSILDQNLITHFSIPNPDLAPYGRIAKQALKNAGLWKKISPILIYGESASQTAMFINTQSVDGALLPQSLAIIMKNKGLGNYRLVAENLYTALNQRMVLLNNHSDVAKEFYNYLMQPSTQKIFVLNGFSLINSKLTDSEMVNK